MSRLSFIAVALLAVAAWFTTGLGPGSIARDFGAFYCSGSAVAHGSDPYRAQPLSDCEHESRAPGVFAVPSDISLPAPLPPFDLAGFSALAELPFGPATVVWLVLITIAFVATIEGMQRLTGLRRSTLWLVFAPIDGLNALYLGEIAPIAVAALVFGMLALRASRARAAALAVVVALCEPHVGLAPLVALFACAPRSRATIVTGLAALAAISIAFVGWDTSVEYVRTVLPAHALSEVASLRQLSLTSLLHALGIGNTMALSLGVASYLAMLLLGAATARRLAAMDRYDPLVIAAPAAFVLTGGVFIHTVQMAAAFPAAVLAYLNARGTTKAMLGVALLMLAVPWILLLPFGVAFPFAAFLVGALASRLLSASRAMAAAYGCTAAAFFFELQLGIALGGPPPTAIALPILPGDLAEVNWGEHIARLANVDANVYFAARVPSWLAVGAMTSLLARVAWSPVRHSHVAESSGEPPSTRVPLPASRSPQRLS